MRLRGGQIAVRALEDEGIPFVFGIPGTHNGELFDALAYSESVRPVLVTHEQAAAFAADAVWRASGRLGCVGAVPGAGLTHAMSGIAEAFLDHIPMLVLSCGVRGDVPYAYQLHDVDQRAMAAPVTKAVLRVPQIDALYATIRQACRLARSGVPGPVMVEVPTEQLFFLTEFTRDLPPDATAADDDEVPDPAALDRAAELLAGARRPLIYVGNGAGEAGAALVALAERLDAPVTTTFQGKGVFPESHPLFLWPGFGPSAPKFVRRIVAGCDVTLAIGCRFAEVATGSYGAPPPSPLIHTDIDPSAVGRNYPAEVGIAADAAATIAGLLDRLPPRDADPVLRRRIAHGHAAIWSRWQRTAGAERVEPSLLLKSLQETFGPQTIFVTDSGNGAFLAMECLRLDGPRRFLSPVDFSCMGYAVPAAVGAKLACPDAPVAALVGDGAFLMTGIELLTAREQQLPIAFLILRDGELGQISKFQQTQLRRRRCVQVPDFDLETFGRSLGIDCLHLERTADIPAVLGRLREKLTEGRPVLVDVAIDYSRRTYFTQGVMDTNFARLPFFERFRIARRTALREVVPWI